MWNDANYSKVLSIFGYLISNHNILCFLAYN